ncbi:DUF1573 domain-containing protein [Algoriphagus machipongonensis]|uniref:DUF1573 domain-containing protein n=1 Tax=Algoriphagus machipongonensis TaxID=388413 RepID=A3HTE2_9BACT|nr:DUF1573 domain-containing protein [Algoriphagus machipongonensis]EAZ83110.1 hypothetical protein ALPR1_12855 [Algoriphagus machipongonensis]
MSRIRIFLLPLSILLLSFQAVQAQDTVVPKLIWAVNKVDLGTVFEEQGKQLAEFEFTHTQDSLFFVEDVWTDCGCTTAEFTKDTLEVGEKGILKVSFDPTSASGYFNRMVIVKGNLQNTQDTLFVEGIAIPYPQDPEKAFPVRKEYVGFRLNKLNMGEVLTNEPKVKMLEFYNFGEETLYKDSLKYNTPEFIQISQVQEIVRSQERGLLQVSYDGKLKGDLGFFEDYLAVSWDSISVIPMPVLADVFEYFPPISKDELHLVPQLSLGTQEIDLKKISANSVQTESVTITNKGQEKLEIRKIQGNCDCLTIEIPKVELLPGESVDLKITFDPKGRKGIDQRNIYLFSNDPVNPVQLFLLKSRVE